DPPEHCVRRRILRHPRERRPRPAHAVLADPIYPNCLPVETGRSGSMCVIGWWIMSRPWRDSAGAASWSAWTGAPHPAQPAGDLLLPGAKSELLDDGFDNLLRGVGHPDDDAVLVRFERLERLVLRLEQGRRHEMTLAALDALTDQGRLTGQVHEQHRPVGPAQHVAVHAAQ